MPLLYRVLLVLLALRFVPFPLSLLPLGGYYTAAWDELIRQTSLALTGAPANTAFNGSGDRLYDYLQLLWQVVLSLPIALGLRALERRGRSSLRNQHLLAYIRYALGSVMIGYGLSKVFPWQFPVPTWFELSRPVGELSPMALLWTFMGISRPYTIAAGIAEAAGGVLLFFPRTAHLGALITAIVMSNVLLLNLCYDAPVKLYAFTYLASALVLVAPRAKHLYLALLPVGAAQARRPRRITVARVLLLALVVCGGLSPLWAEQEPAVERSILGFYDVTTYSSATAEPAWVHAEITPSAMLVRRSDGSQQSYRIAASRHGGADTLTLWPSPGVGPSELWHVERRGDADVALRRSGVREVSLRLRRGAPPSMPLTARGFHWINERPFIQ